MESLTCRWQPQPDIHVAELAMCVPLLARGEPATAPQYRELITAISQLPLQCSRHWVVTAVPLAPVVGEWREFNGKMYRFGQPTAPGDYDWFHSGEKPEEGKTTVYRRYDGKPHNWGRDTWFRLIEATAPSRIPTQTFEVCCWQVEDTEGGKVWGTVSDPYDEVSVSIATDKPGFRSDFRHLSAWCANQGLKFTSRWVNIESNLDNYVAVTFETPAREAYSAEDNRNI